MKYLDYYIGKETEISEGEIIQCINGTIRKEDSDIYISKAMLSDCTSCKNYTEDIMFPCAVNPMYTGLDYCKDYDSNIVSQ